MRIQFTDSFVLSILSQGGTPATLIAERIGLNGGNPFRRGLCTLVDPYSVLGFDPNDLSLL